MPMLGILTPFAVIASYIIHSYSNLKDFLWAFGLQPRALVSDPSVDA
jgi:hypothetical protein